MYSAAQWGGREKWWAGYTHPAPDCPFTHHSHAPYPLQEKVKRKFTVFEGDHLTLLNVYRAFEKVGGRGRGPSLLWVCLMVPALLFSMAGALSGVARTSSTTEGWCMPATSESSSSASLRKPVCACSPVAMMRRQCRGASPPASLPTQLSSTAMANTGRLALPLPAHPPSR